MTQSKLKICCLSLAIFMAASCLVKGQSTLGQNANTNNTQSAPSSFPSPGGMNTKNGNTEQDNKKLGDRGTGSIQKSTTTGANAGNTSKNMNTKGNSSKNKSKNIKSSTTNGGSNSNTNPK
jgi:hypothetical protein